MKPKYNYPFTAISAQENLKLCLLLNLVDPSIGGVLATGDKGTAKTTTVRGLSQLMGTDFPFINLPIGATEDRVLGNINLEALINQKVKIIDKGLLSQAHLGFLYIDEVNLLNDYLMDVLLDASASGGYHLEREGISQWMDSRFCLVGTMNPEEGALRPQLLDRFGLSVNVHTPKDIKVRTQIAMQRLNFDSDPEGFYNQFLEEEKMIRDQVLKARQKLREINIPEKVQEYCAELTIKSQVEGMRADILLLKTSKAYAAYYHQEEVTIAMVDTIAPFVLQHRAKEYTPPSNQDKEELSNTKYQNTPEESTPQNAQNNRTFQLPKEVQQGLKFAVPYISKKQEIQLDVEQRRHLVSYPARRVPEISVVQSVKQYLSTGKFEKIYKQTTKKAVTKIVFLVDTSASMIIDQQIAYLKGVIKKTIASYPKQKIAYAMVGLHEASARIIQEFTTDTDRISEINHELKTAGKTNLGAAFFKVYELIRSVPIETLQLFVFTDGKINTGAENSFRYAVATYKKYLSRIRKTTIIDTETDFVKLGKAKILAQQIQSDYIRISQF